MTAVIAIVLVAALFALSAFVVGRGCGDCDACKSRWFKEKGHGSPRP